MLPNPGMSFTPFDVLPAADLNDIVENVESLADGTGFDDDSISSSKINFGGAGAGVWWEEIGRTTLSVAGDTISVTSIPARKYLYIITNVVNSGALVATLRFNNDSGANYAYRYSSNGGADTVGSSQTSIFADAGSYPLKSWFEVTNVAANEKAFYGRLNAVNTTGAAQVPGRGEIAGKWANTSSQISRVDLLNSGAGDFAIGSEVIVLGHD